MTEATTRVKVPAMTRERRKERAARWVCPDGQRTIPVMPSTSETRSMAPSWTGERSRMEWGHVRTSYICTTGLKSVSLLKSPANLTFLLFFSSLSRFREIFALLVFTAEFLMLLKVNLATGLTRG